MTEPDKILNKVEKPGRYTGGEFNSVIKVPSQVRVRFAFAFPDLYEIGMSYVGLQILYSLLNKEEDIYCERVFAPAVDMEAVMKEESIPLFSLETKTPVRDFHIVGFTLQYEMSYTNILNMLKLSGIPLRREERGNVEPIVVAGGPCAFNPEPLADFFDLFMIGDGEESLPRLLKLYGELKEEVDPKSLKKEFLKRAVTMEGIYVPEFYEPVYKGDGRVAEYKKLYKEAPDRVKKSLIHRIEDVSYPEKPIVPIIEVAQDRAVVEAFRGCTRGCRFCQAGMIYRPVRERTTKKIKELATAQLKATGHDELSLLSLSTSDYSRFSSLATDLAAFCNRKDVSLSLPSLRLDSSSFKVLQEISKYRKTGLTFAPEAGTQRLRDIINKNITEEDIKETMTKAIELGWKRVKLYFMMGLPGETFEDLQGIANIAQSIRDLNFEIMGRAGGRFQISVSVSNFVPKPHTPFQWSSQEEDFVEKHDFLKRKLRIKGVKFHYHDSFISILEGLFARGDRRTGTVLEKAVELGCKFDGWSEHFNEERWRQALEETGTDLAFYTSRLRDYDEVLPWDIIDSGVSKEYLMKEMERAKKALTTPDCREGCTGCGISRYTDCRDISRFKVDTKEEKIDESGQKVHRKSVEPERDSWGYVITFSKTGYIRYTSHLDLMRIFKRAFKKAGIQLEHSKGFNPSPKLSLAQPLSLGYRGMAEMAEFETKEKILPTVLILKLNEQLPQGLEVTFCRYKKKGEKGLAASCSAADYKIEIPMKKEYASLANFDLGKSFLSKKSIPVMKKGKKGKKGRPPVETDIRPMIRSMELQCAKSEKKDENNDKIIMKTKLDAGSRSNLSPELLIKALLNEIQMPIPREEIEITRLKLYMEEN